MSSSVDPSLLAFTIYFRQLLLSKNSKLQLRDPLIKAVNTYVSGDHVVQVLESAGTDYLLIV